MVNRPKDEIEKADTTKSTNAPSGCRDWAARQGFARLGTSGNSSLSHRPPKYLTRTRASTRFILHPLHRLDMTEIGRAWRHTLRLLARWFPQPTLGCDDGTEGLHRMTGGKRHGRNDHMPQRVACHDPNSPKVTTRGAMPIDEAFAGCLIVPGHGLAIEEQVCVIRRGKQLLRCWRERPLEIAQAEVTGEFNQHGRLNCGGTWLGRKMSVRTSDSFMGDGSMQSVG